MRIAPKSVRRLNRYVVPLALCFALAALAGGSAAFANGPTLSIQQANPLTPGQSVDLSGSGYTASGIVNIEECRAGPFHSACYQVGTTTADGNGNISTSLNANYLLPDGSACLTDACSIRAVNASPLAASNSLPVTWVESAANLAVTVSDSPDPVVSGADVTYTVTVTNTGTADATNVTAYLDAQDSSNSSLGFGTVTGTTCSTPGFTLLGGGQYCSFGTIQGGQSAQAQITVTAPASGSTMSMQAFAWADQVDPAPTTDNSATESTTVQSNADVAVTDSVADLGATTVSGKVVAGNTVEYTIVATNNGPAPATNVSVTDTLDSGVLGANPVMCDVAGTGTCSPTTPFSSPLTLPSLGSGQSHTWIVDATLNASALPSHGQLTNAATISSDNPDSTPGNNNASANATIDTRAALSLTNTAADQGPVTVSGAVVAGNHVRYTIKVSNGGPSDAQAVTVTDPLPASLLSGAVFCSTTNASCDPTGGSSPGAGGQLGSPFVLAAGASKTFVVDALLRASALPADGPLNNTAEATTTTVDPNTIVAGDKTAQANLNIDTRAALSLTNVAADQGPVLVSGKIVAGNHVRYTIKVSNGGPSDAQAVTVTDPLPASLLSGAVFCTTTGTTCDPTGGASPGAGGQLGSSFLLAAGASQTFVVDALLRSSALPADGPLNNTAEATTTTVDPSTNVAGDKTAQANLPIDTRADLQVTSMTSSTNLLYANSGASNTVTFTLKFTNAGPSDARAVTASLPEQISPSTIAAFIPDSGTSIGDIAAGSGTTTVTIVAHANPLLGHAAGETPIVPGPLTAKSTALLSSTTQDQTPGNNVLTTALSPNVEIDTTPTPPQNPGAANGNTNAVVSWSAPASNGGQPLDSTNPYQINVYIGNATTPTRTIQIPTSAAQPCLANQAGVCYNVTGLTNGTTYRFGISARNAVGLSDEATATATPTIDAQATIIPPTTAQTLTTCKTATGTQPICVQYIVPTGTGGVAGVQGNVPVPAGFFCPTPNNPTQPCIGNAAFDLISSAFDTNVNKPITEIITWDSAPSSGQGGPFTLNPAPTFYYQSQSLLAPRFDPRYPNGAGGAVFPLAKCLKGGVAKPDPCVTSVNILGSKNNPDKNAQGDLQMQMVITSDVDGLTSKH
ncbi:MAG TPA: CARDB domain-containing protein [Gaiellales bacterium]|nr:CARDB domain-containing protein [Gaiellales bacterium]